MLMHSDGAGAYDGRFFLIFHFHAFCNRHYDVFFFFYYELVIKVKYYDWIIARKVSNFPALGNFI